MARRRETPRGVLARLRRLCLALPETHETSTWGHPNFRVGKRIFAAFHEDREGVPCLWVKVGAEARLDLEGDARFTRARHGAGHWIGLRCDGPVEWPLVRELVQESYRRTAPKRRGSGLDPARGTGRARA